MNILERADQIVNGRTEEKERQYGDFHTTMNNMRDIFNAMTGHKLETRDMYMAMVAMKLARQRFAHKEDNLLDLVAYVGSLNDLEEQISEFKASKEAEARQHEPQSIGCCSCGFPATVGCNC
jgi:ABC-type uncharacterized transport system fused permease/ATPase subunit